MRVMDVAEMLVMVDGGKGTGVGIEVKEKCVKTCYRQATKCRWW